MTEPIRAREVADQLDGLSILITKHAPEEGEVADTLGLVDNVARRLGVYKRAMLSEIDHREEGEMYVISSDGRQCDRSYNESAIFAGIMDKLDCGFVEAFNFLVEQDAIRLTWRWSELQIAFDKADLTMKIAKHEITDGDDEHVGEVWNQRPFAIKGKKS